LTTPTLLFTDTCMYEHDPGPHHPERPDRLRRILTDLRERTIPGTVTRKAPWATYQQLLRAHPTGYVEALSRFRGRRAQLDPDTAMSPGSYDAALAAAGAALHAVAEVMSGRARNAFALIRPPGHHAESHRAMGFCLFNNAVVAIEHARQALGVERVLHIDWDVHHGNGTQHAFYDRPDVCVVDLHRYPFYPGTGALHEVGHGPGEGFNVNIPLPAGLGDPDYALALRELIYPIAESFQPQLVTVSAGFDAHAQDHLADMEVSEDGFAELCGLARAVAETFAGGRLVLLLEGGYHLRALTQSVRDCVEVLTGSTPPESRGPSPRGLEAFREAAAMARRYWRHIG